jgi:hypothetical protein
VLAGLEPTATGLAEGERPAAAVEGRDDFGEEGYSGPLPPESWRLDCQNLGQSYEGPGSMAPEKGVVMAGQITLTEQEARALSSLLGRASDRLATYEEQTHQDRRLAEEIREAADDLVNRIGQGATT